MAASGIGAFAAGLSDGFNNMMQLNMQKKYYDSLNENRDRQNDIRQQKADASENKGSKGSDREGFLGSLMPIFKPTDTNPAPAQRSIMAPQPGLGPDILPNVNTLGSNPAAAYQNMGLESAAKSQPQPAQDEDFNPIHEIVKQVGFGDLANQPDKLNAIRAAAAMHGMGKEVDPWLDSLVASKKSGIFDAAMDLKRGNIDGAMDNLKRGGIQLEDRPTRVDPNDNSKWKVNISGSGEQTINLDDWATSTLDPEKYSKFLLDRQGAADKTRLTDAQIDNQKAGAEKDRAMAKAYGLGSLGAGRRSNGGAGLDDGSRTTKLPAPVATAEWLVQNGVYPDHKSAFNAVKTLNDKSPAAQRQELIKARMQGGAMSLSEAAKEVDDFILKQGGSDQGATEPKVRKWNPQTGKFN